MAAALELVVLGSGTSVPLPDRGSPAALVRTAGALALVDCGPGTLRQLARLGLSPHQVTDLFLTHAHLDHTADLWPLLFYSRIPGLGRSSPLRLHGSRALLHFFRKVAAALGPWAEAPAPAAEPPGALASSYRLEEVEHGGQAVALGGGAAVTGHPVPHIDSSLAFRFVAQGLTLVVSGDTDHGPGIVAAARGADLLLLECATADPDKMDGHLTPSLCAGVAAEAGVRRLLLTHLYPSALAIDAAAEVRRRWPGEVAVAEDLASYPV